MKIFLQDNQVMKISKFSSSFIEAQLKSCLNGLKDHLNEPWHLEFHRKI